MHTMGTLILLTMSASMAAAQGSTAAPAVAGLREAIEARVALVPGAMVAVVHGRAGGPPIGARHEVAGDAPRLTFDA